MTVLPVSFIHYGSSSFEPMLFTPIRNHEFTKPRGGLWASSLASPYSWKDWCEEEEFDVDRLQWSFIFSLKPGTKIKVLETNTDLINVPLQKRERYFDMSLVLPDFEALSKQYDALYFPNPYGELRWKLYGWDVESLLVMKPDCIIELR